MELIGGDLEHALSAWTSTSRDLSEEKRQRIPALLKMLAENGHETPFEKSAIHFLVTSEIATHIQMLKHRIGVSINGESARYKELKEDKYFLPKDWPQEERDLLEQHCLESFEKYHACYQRLVPILGKKRAKESARFYNPYATQLTVDIMFNFRSFVHFQRLRNEEHAQEEIHDIARDMLNLLKQQDNFKHSIDAFKL